MAVVSPLAALTPAAPDPVLGLTDCVAGSGTDYQVGDGKPYTALDQVPWESLKAGDTVRIFYRATPYKGKFLVGASGTSTAPVRICGVRGPGNERPTIDGNGAVSRAALATEYGRAELLNDGSGLSERDYHEQRSVIVIKALAATGTYTSYPQHIQVDGLKIVRAHPNYTFTDTAGKTKSYHAFGAGIWVERGQHITIADNEISDCQMAVFSRSTNDGDFAVTKNLRLAGNYMWGHGIVGDDHEHTTYLQSVGVTVEFNRYGPLRVGALGNQLKDRSAGTVVRYNVIEGGAHSMDFVEAEDNFQYVAKLLPSYRATHVYGNLIYNTAVARAIVHYGGDHFGNGLDDKWGEQNFRQGVLYFFNNTVYGAGASGGELFRISTTLETVEAWNNVFYLDGTTYLRTDENDGLAAGWTRDGILNLGVNWIKSGWLPYDIDHPLTGSVTGESNLLSGSTQPIDTATLSPVAGSALIDAGTSGPAGAAAHPVLYQLDANLRGQTRTVKGTAIDLGAKEF